MKITLNHKSDSTDKSPLIVQFVDDSGSKKSVCINIGQTVELPDSLAYELMAKYKGFFTMDHDNHETKRTKTYADKSARAE